MYVRQLKIGGSPSSLLPADDAFLHVLIVMDAPRHQIKRRCRA
jgi:hypothetical protein